MHPQEVRRAISAKAKDMGITFYTGLKLGENKQSDITNTELITSGFSLRSRKERNKLRALAQKSPKSEQIPPDSAGEKKKPTIDEGL